VECATANGSPPQHQRGALARGESVGICAHTSKDAGEGQKRYHRTDNTTPGRFGEMAGAMFQAADEAGA
jgi:hypothetical protein